MKGEIERDEEKKETGKWQREDEERMREGMDGMKSKE